MVTVVLYNRSSGVIEYCCIIDRPPNPRTTAAISMQNPSVDREGKSPCDV